MLFKRKKVLPIDTNLKLSEIEVDDKATTRELKEIDNFYGVKKELNEIERDYTGVIPKYNSRTTTQQQDLEYQRLMMQRNYHQSSMQPTMSGVGYINNPPSLSTLSQASTGNPTYINNNWVGPGAILTPSYQTTNMKLTYRLPDEVRDSIITNLLTNGVRIISDELKGILGLTHNSLTQHNPYKVKEEKKPKKKLKL